MGLAGGEAGQWSGGEAEINELGKEWNKFMFVINQLSLMSKVYIQSLI